ncbi:hypothetical protein PEC301877_38090 [Pectobacterium carotovorum subsp. carotovorum]|nr:hypothetical protein PEC301877_38090 [Pectobacterium carotovorum subsp. carotovorum]
MAGHNRRNFSPEFRLEAAQLVLDQHRDNRSRTSHIMALFLLIIFCYVNFIYTHTYTHQRLSPKKQTQNFAG